MKTAPYILVIDDENHICESCDRIFSKAGYRVDTNINATSGFRQALTNPYDAIILDLNLVESDGMTLLYGIRKRKPDVPVVIITGYPSDDTRRISSTMGVTDYITKPFEQAEILEPVRRIITGAGGYLPEADTIPGEEITEKNYHYLSSWFYQMGNGMVRVGGYLPNLSNYIIRSIKLPEPGSVIYRGLPLAEVELSDGTKQIIPSPISGKTSLINNQLRDYLNNLERNINKNNWKNWIATVDPSHLEQDLNSSETRRVLVFGEKNNEENEFCKKFVYMRYSTIIASDIDQVLNILSARAIQVLVLDAGNFGDSGPEYVSRISREFPDIKIIVCNEPDVYLERQYRKNNIFYYGVTPISNNEMVDILHCAFTDDKRKITLQNPLLSRFLPNTISKISITNRYGMKVTLLAYNEILQHKFGLGYLLTQELLDMAFPLEMKHSRLSKSFDEATEIQKITNEKEKNDRIIILQARNLDKIPGSIVKDTQKYRNHNSSFNSLININIQPGAESRREVEFDYSTTIALKDIIKNEMISK